MSAYMVDREHVIYLVKAAISKQLSLYDGGSIQWFYNGEQQQLRVLESMDRLVDIGQMLWNENLKSINSRYPDTIDNPQDIPGPIDEDFIIQPTDFRRLNWIEFKPSQVLASIRCYNYQACEHEGWSSSEAHAFINALKEKCISVISDKGKWGAPKPMTA